MMSRSCVFATVILVLAVGTHSSVDEEATCDFVNDASCERSPKDGQASLLQKAFNKNEVKTFAHDHHTKEAQPRDARGPSRDLDISSYAVPNRDPAISSYAVPRGNAPNRDPAISAYSSVCTGVTAQGKCWYLSELGDTCSATCAAKGKAFSYVVSDTTQPVTPTLVGHEPSAKQQPWAALECYVPSEDRYHTANANAAKHFETDIGAWSHESCKLACPCGEQATTPKPIADATECDWVQPTACAEKFEWKGSVYSGCAVVDMAHDRPWCQHGFDHKEYKNAPQDWSYCNYECKEPTPAPVPVPEDTCRWTPAYSCVKEYDYQGTHYVGCTAVNNDVPWCSNADPYKGSWNHCVYSCAESAPEVVSTTDDVICSWQQRPECSGTFEYKGVEYSGCTTVDHPTPWCSHDRNHKGSWTTCQKVCNKPSVPVPTVPPTPVTPAPPAPREEDPCERHPDAENDIIGATVSLDEAGYKVAASGDNPINVKRFICRVAGKLECRVMDLPSLMAFVPYYSGLVSTQTYMHLESELSTLCHAGGKWIVPLSNSYWNQP